MTITLSPRTRALTFLGALLIFACIVAIGVLIINILIKAIQHIPPPMTQPGPETNIVSLVSFAEYQAATGGIQLPAFTFSEEQVAEIDPEAFAATGELLIERSTNLVDWSPAWRISVESEFSFASDTNPPAPQCFYRMVLVR